MRGLEGGLHEREEVGRKGWEHEKTFKLGCDGVGGEGWGRRGWGVGNGVGVKVRSKLRSRSGRNI